MINEIYTQLANEGLRDTLRTAAVTTGLGLAGMGGLKAHQQSRPIDAPASVVQADRSKKDVQATPDQKGRYTSSGTVKKELGSELPIITKAAIRNDIQVGSEDFAILLAIRKAENGPSGLEFGVLHPRAKGTNLDVQAGWAAATIKKNRERWIQGGRKGDFISFLGSRYCPVGADNDPQGLNKNWIRNVTYWTNKFLEKE